MDLALLDFHIMKFPFPAQLHVVWSYVFVDILNAVEFNNIDMWSNRGNECKFRKADSRMVFNLKNENWHLLVI